MKILLFHILLSLFLVANDNYELKLYEKVIPILLNSKIINIYTDSNTKDTVKGSSIFYVKKNCLYVDLIIGKKINNLDKSCENIPIFATTYKAYLSSPNAIGVFYYRKGRPQLKLNSKTIKKFKLNLPQSLEKYAE